mgnify:FL=1
MKPYPALKTRYYYETKEILEQYKEDTVKSAAEKLGIDPSNLRTLAYRMGVEFHRANGTGKTTIDTVERKRNITLPMEPWKED